MPCRLCNGSLYEIPVLTLQRVPASAQSLVDDMSNISCSKTIDLILTECSGCGLLQLTNQPVKYYKEVITSASVSPKMLKFRYEQLQNWLNIYNLKGKRIIEIGCGNGYLLDILEELGAEAWGLEYSSTSVKIAQSRGRNVIQGYPNEIFSEVPSFDGFICINFLEHSPYPGEFLQGIHKIINNRSIGLVEVPNFEKDILFERYYDLIIDHLSYFNQATLERTLSVNGFDIISTGKCWDEDDIYAVIQKREPLNYQHWKISNSILQQIDAVISDPKFERVAIWGASHQSLSLLSMTHSLPVCIIDSASFKQNKYEPCRGIKIIPPKDLNQFNINTIIVMAASYSDEVVNTLIHQMGYVGNIFKLGSKGIVSVQESCSFF